MPKLNPQIFKRLQMLALTPNGCVLSIALAAVYSVEIYALCGQLLFGSI